MIMPGHVSLWRRILDQPLPGSGRWLVMGVQDITVEARGEVGFDFPSLTELLKARGIAVSTLDLFDARADIRHDLNLPLPTEFHSQFDVLLDIGTIEHVFDTRQVLINYLTAVRMGGQLCLHLPVSGYHRHGLHTFHPELLPNSLKSNGCEVIFESYSDHRGREADPEQLRGIDALQWIVATKSRSFGEFRNPQQIGWQDYYS